MDKTMNWGLPFDYSTDIWTLGQFQRLQGDLA